MKYILIAFLFLNYAASAQNKPYAVPPFKEYDVCTDSSIYKGKKNHGKYYCVGYMRIRENVGGKKDTLWRSFGGSGKMFFDAMGEKYIALNERGQYVVDSLLEDGIGQMQNEYLHYESIYMKKGQKTHQMWDIQGNDVVIYEYKIWRTDKSNGFELIHKIEVK